MIGQERIIDKVNKWKEVPRFIILNGIMGCGKKTLAKYISNKFNFDLIIIGNKIDEIREMIKLANESNNHIIFLIDNGNKMSLGAENTLLKIIEEAPNNSHIILSVENKDLLLPTILSRGELLNFEKYSKENFKRFLGHELNYDIDLVYPNFLYLQKLPEDKGKELLEFCNKIVDNIRIVNGASAFKITEKIKLKDEQEGFDLFQFVYTLKNVISSRLLSCKDSKNFNYLYSYILILNKIEEMLMNPLFNKSYILDKLIIELKAVYYE